MFDVVFWLIAVVVSVAVEVLTLGLVGIWFAVGALAALVASAFSAPFIATFFLFGAVSAAMILYTRPLAMKYFNKNRERTNVESLIGQTAIVTIDIDNLAAQGEVLISGNTWTARSIDDEIKPLKGEKVVVVGISGVKLFVAKPEPIKLKEVIKAEALMPEPAEDALGV